MRSLISPLTLLALGACVRENTVEIHNEAPEVSLLVPVDGAQFFSDEAIEVCARASDDQNDLTLLAMSLASDLDGLLWSSTYAPEAIGACDDGQGVGIALPPLSLGTHTLAMRAVDTRGEDAEALVTVTVQERPNTAPNCEITAPLSGTVSLEGDDTLFSAAVGDGEQDAGTLLLRWSSDEDGLLSEAPADSSGTSAFHAVLSPGDHLVELSVEDSLGARDVCFALIKVDACADRDGDGVSNCAGDCDEHDPESHPGAAELPDLEDNDCDGTIDEGTVFYDDDGDGFCEGPLSCADGALPGDCDDAAPAVFPGAPEDGGTGDGAGNGLDDDCDGLTDEGTAQFDDDGDGASELAGDCDDTNALVRPSAAEICDGADNDCNGQIDDKDYDRDGDLDAACGGDDCDDYNPYIHPDAAEICGNGDDDDCDGTADNADEDGDGHRDAACGGDDCHDQSALVAPGLPERCDRLDNDCDGEIDNLDADRDGFYDASCGAGDDCDDRAAAVHPGAAEVCGNALDEDCSGATDDLDLDGDGFDARACGGADCLDTNAAIHPLQAEVCGDHLDNDCSSVIDDLDADRDGAVAATCGGDDCLDSAAAVRPGVTEVCGNLVDEDCSGALNDLDQDGDGFGVCDARDCDDARAGVHPDALEVCDGADQDCDGLIDNRDLDGDGHFGCGGGDCDDLSAISHAGAAEVPDTADNDCDGTADEGTVLYDDDRDGFSEADGDCDDAEPRRAPGLPEVCGDGLDNDCSRLADDLDTDGDGYAPEACGGDDCDDTDGDVFPGALEVCGDGLDNDCSGDIDDLDADGDLFAAEACGGDDCDDDNYLVNPSRAEVCGDLEDEDCSGDIDDPDLDGDGYFDGEGLCGGDDCDDTHPMVFPGAVELWDGVANDCDGSGVVDDGAIPAGAVVITEAMIDVKNTGSLVENTGEWVELANTSARRINLDSWWMVDADTDDFEIIADNGLWIDPGETLLFCAEGAPSLNGGLSCDYDYDKSAFSLSEPDEIRILIGSLHVDDVDYLKAASGWNFGEGRSLSLSPQFTNATANNAAASWCRGDTLYFTGNYGTPGAPNPACSAGPEIAWVYPREGVSAGGEVIEITGDHFTGAAAVTVNGIACTAWSFVSDERLICTVPAGSPGPASVAVRVGATTATLSNALRYTGPSSSLDACVMEEPAVFTAAAGEPSRLFKATLTEAGLTGISGAPAGVIAQLGYGPVGTVPGVAKGWTWEPAMWWEQAGGADRFARALTLPNTGTYAVAWRFSSDDLQWRYCDRGAGSANGVAAADLGSLTVR